MPIPNCLFRIVFLRSVRCEQSAPGSIAIARCFALVVQVNNRIVLPVEAVRCMKPNMHLRLLRVVCVELYSLRSTSDSDVVV